MHPETHLIPNNYIGEVTIEFNSKNGDKRERKNGSRIYRIHPNGTLQTKFSKNYGWIKNPTDFKFFYYDSVNDTLHELIWIDWPERIALNKVNSNSIVVQNYYIANKNDKEICSYLVDTLKNFPYYNHYIDSLRSK
jgi:hypothetical protein